MSVIITHQQETLELPQCFALKLYSMITSASDRTPNGTMYNVRTNSMSHGCDGFLDEIAKHLFYVYFFLCFCYLALFARVGLLKSWSSHAFLPTSSENRVVACTRKILVFSRSFYGFARRKLYSQKFSLTK